MARRRALLAAPALLALARPARAQRWPERPVRLVAPFPAGSGTDILARTLAEPLAQRIGQPVVVENRPGANGALGASQVAAAPPDGHALLMFGTSAAVITPHLLRRPPYDTLRDFAPVGAIAETPYILVVHPSAPGRDLAGWIAAMRTRGQEVTLAYGNAGGQIMAAMLARDAGLRVTPVPYRGSAEALTDVFAGRVDATFADFGVGVAQSQAGQVKALAQTGARPFPLAPQMPAMAATLPGFDANVWFSLVAPAGTPSETVERAAAALDAVLASPAMAESFAAKGLAPLRMGPAALAAHFRSQLALWGERVALAGIEPQ